MAALDQLYDQQPPVTMASWLADFESTQVAPIYRIADELMVEVREHAVASAHGARSATSYITCGLATYRQPEVIFTWAAGSLEIQAAAVAAALRAVGRAVASGTLILRPGVGFYLGEDALVEHVGLSGLLFVPAQAMPGLTPVPGALHAIAVTSAELEVAMMMSPHRVISRLGLLHRRFPCPAWSAPRRSVATPWEPTILATSPRAVVPGLTVERDGVTLTVRLPRSSAAHFAEVLGAMGDAGVALVTAPSPDADAHRVWNAGSRDAVTVTRPRTSPTGVAGGFLRIVDGEHLAATALEDGYQLTVDAVGRDELLAVLACGLTWYAHSDAGDVQVRLDG